MSNPSDHIKQLVARLPEKPGVYQYFNQQGEIIYVGKAKNLRRRVSSYFQKEHEWLKTRQLVAHIADLKYVVVDSEQDAFLLENNLIKQYQPHYNIMLKDGKSYPSICITREDFPRIFKTRKILKGVGEYFGPYSYGNTVDLVVELIHKLFPIRTCNTPMTAQGVETHKYRLCLKYHLHTCCGICEQCIPTDEYHQYIARAKQIIRGDAREIARQLESEMTTYATRMEYEKAQECKEKLDLIDKFCSKTVISNTHLGEMDVFGYDEQDNDVFIAMLHVRNGSIVQGQTIKYRRHLDEPKEELLAIGMMELRQQLGSTTREVLVPFIPDGFDENMHIHIALSGDKKRLLDLAMQNVRQYKQDKLKQADKLNPDQRAARILGRLQELLGLQKMPVFIDSFDNSNIQGSDPVAGCVVFRKAKPSKKDYKLFRIKTVEGQDDYASMREVVYRRYSRLLEEGSDMPNLIIADGGIGQMHAIREAVEDGLGLHIPIAGLVKDDRHRTSTLLVGFPPKEVGMKPTDEVFMFLTRIQDEVHRYAISFHKQRRSKRRTESELDEIAGVGEKTKKELLLAFHSIKRLKEAKLEDIQLVAGTKRGSDIYNYFHGKISS
ncbi:MAG: excinuclease ABC subunit C [Paludibacteraceae bacterium]|nr:excinuclease ABC subunit C [Paludibacteraceae bacterium]